MHDSNKPHGCTSDSNKPHGSLIWLAHFPNKPNLLNKATGCYIPQSRVGKVTHWKLMQPTRDKWYQTVYVHNKDIEVPFIKMLFHSCNAIFMD